LRAGHDAAVAAQARGEPVDAAGEAAIAGWKKALAKAQPSAGDPETVADIAVMQSGGLPEVAARQAKVSLILQTIVAAKWWFLDALAMMVLGMVLCREGLLTRPQPARRWLVVAAGAFAVGLPLGLWQTSALLGSGFDPVTVQVAKLGYDARRLATALGWLALLFALASSGALVAVRRALAAAGRMALTNYLAQSVLCALLFYGFGLGLYGRVTGFWLYAVVAGIWALELAWSGWWLARFRLGPAEWLWRSITYRRAQDWRVAPQAAAG
jgi:uncharacterized protein